MLTSNRIVIIFNKYLSFLGNDRMLVKQINEGDDSSGAHTMTPRAVSQTDRGTYGAIIAHEKGRHIHVESKYITYATGIGCGTYVCEVHKQLLRATGESLYRNTVVVY